MNPPQTQIASKFHLLKAQSPMATPELASSGVCSSGAGASFDVDGTSVMCRGDKEILVVSLLPLLPRGLGQVY
jgi:hypothetical protein